MTDITISDNSGKVVVVNRGSNYTIAAWTNGQFESIKLNEPFLEDFEIVGMLLKKLFKESPVNFAHFDISENTVKVYISDKDITKQLKINGYIVV